LRRKYREEDQSQQKSREKRTEVLVRKTTPKHEGNQYTGRKGMCGQKRKCEVGNRKEELL